MLKSIIKKTKGNQKEKRQFLKGNKKKHKKYRFSTSDSSSSISSSLSSSELDSDSDSDVDQSRKSNKGYAMFNPCENEEEFVLDENLSKFVSKYFGSYLDEETMAKVLKDLPFPKHENLQVPKLDEDWLDLLEEDKRNIPLIKSDKNLSRVQGTVMRTMAPLAQLWSTLDGIKKNKIPSDMELNDTLKLVEKTVICLGQVNVQMNFFRRLPFVAKLLGNTKKAQKMIVKNADCLDGKKELLGKKFQKLLRKSVKKKKENRELKKALTNPNQRVSFRPFRGGPSTAAGVGGRGTRFDNDFSSRGAPAYRRGRGFNPRYRGRYTKGTWVNNVKLPKFALSSSSFAPNKVTNTRTNSENGARIKICDGKTKTRDFENGVQNADSGNENAPSGRKIKVLFRELGENYTGSRSNSVNQGHENRLDELSNSIPRTIHPEIQCKRKSENRRRDSKTAQKTSNSRGGLSSRSSNFAHFSSPEKRWRCQTGHKSEKGKSKHPLSTFQNGKHDQSGKHAETGGLYGQVRPQGRLFFSADAQSRSKIPEVQMEKQNLRIHGNGVRSGTSPSKIHQVTQTSNSPFKENGDQSPNLFRRSDFAPSGSREIERGSENRNFPIRESGVFNKLGENDNHTLSGDRVLGDGHRLSEHDFGASKGKTKLDSCSDEGNFETQTGNGESVSTINRQTYGCYSSSSIGPSPLQTSSDGQCHSVDEKSKLRKFGHFEQGLSRRPTMVDSISRDKQWKYDSETVSGGSDNDRCLRIRLGGLDIQLEDRGRMESRGEKMAYKCQRAQSWDYGDKSICKANEQSPHNVVHGQCYSCSPSKQKIEHCVQTTVAHSDRDVGILQKSEYLSFGNLHPGEYEHSRRHVIPKLDRVQQLDDGQISFQSDRASVGKDGSRFVCRQTKFPKENVCELETGPLCHEHGRFSDQLGENKGLCVPPILPHWQNTKENKGRKIRHLVDHPYMAHSNVVSEPIGDVGESSHFITPNEGFIEKPKRPRSSLSGAKRSHSSGMESIGDRAKGKGISDDAASLLQNKWRRGTQVSYEYAWGKWSSWCRQRQINPFQASVVDVVNFLSDMYHLGYEYSTINGFRSGISAIHPRIDKVPLGQHEEVSAIMAGIFNANPPTPKYQVFWDVSVVLEYIKSLGDNDRLEPRDLTWKLVTLLALVTASRSSDLTALDTSFMNDVGDKVIFQVKALEKTRKVGQKPRTVIIYSLPEEPRLDPVNCLRLYIERTSHLRPKQGNQLFISTVSPFQPVKSSTIAGWLKRFLDRAGIDTSIWTAHSIRGASTSKALKVGVSVQSILESANWKSVGTFRKFYNKPMHDGNADFQKKVLDSCKWL